MVGAAALGAMKPSGVFINVGRGKCVDEEALIKGGWGAVSEGATCVGGGGRGGGGRRGVWWWRGGSAAAPTVAPACYLILPWPPMCTHRPLLPAHAVLSEGRIRGAALDVMAVEPLPPTSPLWTMADRLLLSPHCADKTKVGLIMCGNTCSYMPARLRPFPPLQLVPTWRMVLLCPCRSSSSSLSSSLWTTWGATSKERSWPTLQTRRRDIEDMCLWGGSVAVFVLGTAAHVHLPVCWGILNQAR